MNRLKSNFVWAVITAALAASFAFAQAPADKQVEVFGQKIHYLEAGSAANPTVILLHGLGGDTTNWALTVPALAAHYRVLVPDQIGFGQSDKPLINYRVATLVEFLNGFYKQVGIERASLVGNSLGGWTAAAFALAYPAKMERLVLVDAAGYSPERWGGPKMTREALSQLNPATPAAMKQTMSIVFHNQALLTDQMVEKLFTDKLRRNDGYTINQFVESVLRGDDFLDGKTKNIKAPTLVVWGREDLLTPLGIGEAFAQDIPGAQKVVIDKCGHVPQIECGAAFNAALLKFLAAGQTATK